MLTPRIMPAAFGRLRVETLMSHFCACGLSDQPPSGGCELKRPEFEPKVLAFAKTELSQMPPEQWKFALQTFYNGLKQAANPVRQKVQPLRGGMPAGGAAAPQSLEEAMFGGM